jgi:hypothetical protein
MKKTQMEGNVERRGRIYLSRKSGKESKPEMTKCKCEIFIEKIT